MVSHRRRPIFLMDTTRKIYVRFVCPWRDCRPHDVVMLPADLAADLIRVHIATPAGPNAQRSTETTAGVRPTMIETRAIPH